ncbi:MAG TPA: ParB/RepB/Spo0J family partition protein [Candidatus Saccharimonadia bacterium]|jgi:ParB family chromosome partitioning protein|nr:ParB/RepB/Spo0J family partition protein [Candidatus Saccharimonadia bacterium]
MNDGQKTERKRGLGRGFDSLIPTDLAETEFDTPAAAPGEKVSGDLVREVDPALVDPNPHQPRKNFDQTALEALAASIRVHGILQPLVVTKTAGRYELIAGERRLRAAKLAGLTGVPVIVRSFDEQEKLELALIENLQREELNPIETATAYRRLLDEFNLRLEDLSKRIGRDISTISNATRLLNLPEEAKNAVIQGRISEGHARVLLTIVIPDDKPAEEAKRLELLALMERHHWTVRQAEEFARGFRGKTGTKEKAAARIAAVNQLTMNLGDYLGAKVTQVRTAKGGKLVIEYYSDEELERIYKAIRGAEE